MSGLDPALAELALAHGVATHFSDWRGGNVEISAAAVTGVLNALGVDVSSADAVQHALAEAREATWRRMMPPYLVIRGGSQAKVAVHVVHGATVSVRVDLEDGGQRDLEQLMDWVDPRQVDEVLVGEATFAIPDDVALGYHTLVSVSGERHERSPLIVVPDRLGTPDSRAWGFMLQLYAARSVSSWGMGDLHDLAKLATWSAHELGADFVLVNPLHAVAPVPPIEPSPYYPASRRFVNPLYLRVEDVDEVRALPMTTVEAAAAPLKRTNDVDADIDRDAVWAAKRGILHRAFEAPREPIRQDAFVAFVEAQGEALTDFATWCALVDRHGLPWSNWPQALRDPRSAAVADFRADERALVDFHAWLQWLCAEQLGGVQRAARDAGMTIGIVHDLAVGASPAGADAWALHDVLAHNVSLGAPADVYNQQGQCWNLPPWHPAALAAAGFAPYRDMVRSVLGNGGGLRVDHIIGLFRQWWIPEGAAATDGAYVRLDHEAMVGVLMLEAHRAGALLVGEDLGTVEPWVRGYLRDRGLFGTSILWFEHDDAGHPRPPHQWRDLCLATVSTHDLPPAAGYLLGEHVELRAELGLLERSVEEEREVDEAGRVAWLRALVDVGLLDPAVVAAVTTLPEPGSVSPRRDRFASRLEPYIDAVVDAAHAYLALTPAKLIGIYLPDLVGDRRPVNQPGTVDEYPNWRVPMTDAKGRPVLLDELMESARPKRLARLVTGASPSVTVASTTDQAST